MQIFLTTSDSKLRARDGMFEVLFYDKDGRQHKSQHAPSIVDSIWLHDGASVSVAALRLAMQNHVDVVFCDHFGDPDGRVMSFRPSTTSSIQKAQALVSISPQALEYARGWIVRKLQTQIDFLESLARRRGAHQKKALEHACQQIQEMLRQMQSLDLSPPDVAEPAKQIAHVMRGMEGAASRAFYEALAAVIPTQYKFEGRSKRPARDVFNAFLNYAFAVLYRKVERAIIAAGLNSYIGFMHRDGYQFKSLVFDLIEPFRTDMVRAVFSLFTKQAVKSGTHAVFYSDSSVKLTKEGKNLLMLKINRFYEKKTIFESLTMSRDRAIENEARRLAQSMVRIVGIDNILENKDLQLEKSLSN